MTHVATAITVILEGLNKPVDWLIDRMLDYGFFTAVVIAAIMLSIFVYVLTQLEGAAL